VSIGTFTLAGGSSSGGSSGNNNNNNNNNSNNNSGNTGSSGSSGSNGGSSGNGVSSSGSGNGSTTGLTDIYINDVGGTIYQYNSADWNIENVIVRNTGAFSISSGPAANSLYLQLASLNSQNGYDGPLAVYDLVNHTTTSIGGDVPGNAFGEGRNGYLYSGSGASLYRVDPANGATVYVGDGPYGFAGDIAVDPTSNVMYGAVSGPYGVTLVTIDRNSAGQAVVGPLGVLGDIWGLGFSGDGTLYATGPDGSGGGAIYHIDKSTGTANQARALNYEPYDMATQPYNVPEDQHPDLGGGGAATGSAAGGATRIETPEGPKALRWHVWGVEVAAETSATAR
jgi:hypothetical protein